MKTITKAVAFILAVMMLTGMAALSAAAEEIETITVSLRIEGIEENIYYNTGLVLPVGSTVADLVDVINGMDDTPEIVMSDGSFGAYISAIDDLAEFSFGDMSGWSYRVNGADPSFGISHYELEDGDSVIYFFGDPFGVGMQYPAADLSMLLSEGVIVFTSIDTTYDADWTPVISENPVMGATVTFNGRLYFTDENGAITIEDKTGLAGFNALKIEKYDEESGVPTVLRFAPDYTVYVPFADAPDGEWYSDAVMFCVGEGYFIGVNLARNLFAPLQQMTVEQLITVLARIAGVDVAAPSDPWYAASLEWAIENEIVDADAFASGTNVTREEFIFMFFLTAALAGDYDMTVRADITEAVDFDDITEDYIEAVSWAVASGIISGTDDNALTIDPGLEINRATACRMLFNYYN